MAIEAPGEILQYIWPGGAALVFDAGVPTAAVFGSGGWQTGTVFDVFRHGPAPGAERARIALPRELVEAIATLQFSGAGLHTDFVYLDRYVAHLQSEGATIVLLVLGPSPAVLAVDEGAVSVLEPRGVSTEVVLQQARGWIVVASGQIQMPADVARGVEPDAALEPALVTPPVMAEPSAERAPDESGVGARESPESPTAAAEPGEVHEPGAGGQVPQAIAAAAANGTAPRAPAVAPAGDFGRFPPEARFVLSSGSGALPADVTARIRAIVGDGARAAVLDLLDGSRTLAQIAAQSGLTPEQVSGLIEALVAHRLAFRYVSRQRPAAGVSSGGPE